MNEQSLINQVAGYRNTVGRKKVRILGEPINSPIKNQHQTYSTSELAQIIGVHPNTIRKYEEFGFIAKPKRKANGYRVFTELHLFQAQLVRVAFRVELVQNNLRKEVLEIIRASAQGEFERCQKLIAQRHAHLQREHEAAERAVEIAEHYHASNSSAYGTKLMTRTDTAHHLSTSIDALRNWEMNGLLHVKRRQNGYRVYNEADINKLSLIRALRMANYSLASIKRLLDKLESNPGSDIRAVLDTPEADEDIVSVCDRLITSLDEALCASTEMTELVTRMEKIQ